MDEVEIRPATTEDTPRIVGLLRTVFGAEDLTASAAYWRWKHLDNPFGPSPVLVAELGGHLVGLRAFMRWTWRAGARDVAAVRAVDTATHPDWRGKGIFSRLTSTLVEQVTDAGVGFVFNTPNDKSMPGYLKMGWELVTRIPICVTLGRPSVLVRRLMRPDIAAPSLAELPSVSELLAQRGVGELLAAARSNDSRLHTERTASYLLWRYQQIPGIDYRGVASVKPGGGALAIVRGRTRRSFRELTVSELVVTPTTTGVLEARRLLRRLRARIAAEHLTAAAASGTAESLALALAGFVRVRRLGPHFTVRHLNAVSPEPLDWSNWRCGIGELEVF